jgi:uncharacterized protein
VIRRLEVAWPDADLFEARAGRPVRLLAVSDVIDPAFDSPVNREALGPLDLIVGCGDLEPDYLAFLGDAFGVPLVYVRGNHDRGIGWQKGRGVLPDPLPGGRLVRVAGVRLIGLEWPGVGDRCNPVPRGDLAWRQVLAVGLVRSAVAWLRRDGGAPTIVFSHTPPFGIGDVPSDAYHRGFPAYRWLQRRLRPILWLHGHTPTAAMPDWRVRDGATLAVNVTGAVLVTLRPPDPAPAPAPPARRT